MREALDLVDRILEYEPTNKMILEYKTALQIYIEQEHADMKADEGEDNEEDADDDEEEEDSDSSVHEGDGGSTSDSDDEVGGGVVFDEVEFGENKENREDRLNHALEAQRK